MAKAKQNILRPDPDKFEFYYGLYKDVRTNPGMVVMYDQVGNIPMLHKEIGITDIRCLMIFASLVDPYTNVFKFKHQDINDIQHILTRNGLNYTEETIRQARKKLTKLDFMVNLKRGYSMINPQVIYYAGKTSIGSLKTKTGISSKKLLDLKETMVKHYYAIRSKKSNPTGAELAEKTIYDIFRANRGHYVPRPHNSKNKVKRQ